METQPKPRPGAITIRPTRTSAEKEPGKFYPLLEELRGPGTLPLRKIAELTGDNSLNPEPNILRKIKGQTLSEDVRRVVLRHIFDDQLLSGKMRRQLAGTDDAFYFAFLNHFDVSEETQDDARAHAVGTYKFWRYSVDHEGEFVLGKLTCFEDSQTKALKIELRMRKSGDETSGSIDRHFSGYLFCLHQMYLTVARRPASDEVRITLYPRARMDAVGTEVNTRSVFSGKHNHIVHMDGVTFGIDSRNCFLSPVHVSLVDDVDDLAVLDEALDVLAEGDARLPARIVNKLRRHGPLKWL